MHLINQESTTISHINLYFNYSPGSFDLPHTIYATEGKLFYTYDLERFPSEGFSSSSPTEKPLPVGNNNVAA